MQNKYKYLLELVWGLAGAVFIWAFCWFGALMDYLFNGAK